MIDGIPNRPVYFCQKDIMDFHGKMDDNLYDNLYDKFGFPRIVTKTHTHTHTHHPYIVLRFGITQPQPIDDATGGALSKFSYQPIYHLAIGSWFYTCHKPYLTSL